MPDFKFHAICPTERQNTFIAILADGSLARLTPAGGDGYELTEIQVTDSRTKEPSEPKGKTLTQVDW